MRDTAGGGASIRRRLLAFLVSSLVLMVAGAGAVTYWVALRSANNAYDRSLLDPAIDIAENVRIDESGRAHVDLPRQALEALVYDQTDRVMFQVRGPDNAIVDGATDLPPVPELGHGQQAFFDSVSDGEKIRVAAHRTASGYVVQVGETLHKRNRLIGEILAAELVPTLLVALAAIALASVGVARGLRPLEQLRTDLLGRSSQDLRPLPASGAPVEIAPLVDAFNRLLDQVRAATATRQQFLANAAHQLRTPLAGLQMHLELLLRRPLPADIRGEVTRLHGATMRAARIANQLLALARAENVAGAERKVERVDLCAIAGDAAGHWVPVARDRRIDLGFSLEAAEVDGDPLLLSELLDNLLDNALRYTPPGGAVTVLTGCRDGTPFLCVEDTGPGIPPDERAKVRERFYRVPGTPGDGSGLGLAIVQEVVDGHRATLEIDASDAHGGARLSVRFPRAAVAAAA